MPSEELTGNRCFCIVTGRIGIHHPSNGSSHCKSLLYAPWILGVGPVHTMYPELCTGSQASRKMCFFHLLGEWPVPGANGASHLGCYDQWSADGMECPLSCPPSIHEYPLSPVGLQHAYALETAHSPKADRLVLQRFRCCGMLDGPRCLYLHLSGLQCLLSTPRSNQFPG